MFLESIGHLITALAAAVAVAGDTWHSNNIGLKKVTKTGWVAISIALLGFSVSLSTTIIKHQESIAREKAAAQEIHDSWSVIISPFRVFLWELNGVQPNPDANMLQRILDENYLERINKEIDLRGEAPHYYGPWLNLLCKSAKNGMQELRQSQTIYVGIIGIDLVIKIKDVVQSQAIEYMRITSPCGDFDPPKEYFLHLHTIANLNDFKTFITAMLELKRELDKYDVVDKT